MKIKPAGKIAILLVVVGIAFGIYRAVSGGGGFSLGNLVPEAAVRSSTEVKRIDLPGIDSTGTSTSANVAMPGEAAGCTDLPEVRLLGYAWNAHMGLHFANGGAQATKGSLMCANGVNLKFGRQDDNAKLTEALVSFATAYSRGDKNPRVGAHFVTVMGDGSAAFLKGLNDALGRLGPEYKAKIVGSLGYSRGEDKFMGPQEWKDNPRAAMGGVVAGVLRDGDWNIAQKWLGDNGLKTNPDEKTYDPDALNWIAANDYLDAPEKYITGYTETRPVVRNGKRTGETKKIRVDGVVTWTPGDVNVATKKGGLVSIVSTKEYSSQMPCVVIGIDKWMRENRPTVEGLLLAAAQGGDAVKGSREALRRGAAVSAKVYNEASADAAYWEKYFIGTVQKDPTGLDVELGGSSASNLSDMLLTFGLLPGSSNLFAATYTVFGNTVVAQYPDLVPSIATAEQIQDLSYLKALASRAAPDVLNRAPIAVPTLPKGETIRNVVSRRNWNIQFESGRAAFSPSAARTLQSLRQDLLIAGGTVIEIQGHTDSVGDPTGNMKLSEDRAFAVRNWLMKQSSRNFPESRFRVYAKGQTNPVASNSTAEGRAKNRRVEIVIGTTR
ncbi:MAG: OmpA family protein [Fimbriimonas sp.]